MMRQIEMQPHDYELSDEEFFKLMEMENPNKTSSNTPQTSEEIIQKYQSKFSTQNIWLTAATVAVFTIYLLPSFSA